MPWALPFVCFWSRMVPRYYFHLEGYSTFQDDAGEWLASDAEALAAGEQIVLELAPSFLSGTLVIVRGGARVAALPLSNGAGLACAGRPLLH